MTQLDKAKEMFSEDIYATEQTGIEIEAVSDRYAKVSLKTDKRHKNAVGNIMGGVIYTMADFAFAVATNLDGNMTVTLTSQANYLASPKGDVLYAETRLIKDGKRNCFYEVEVTDNTDRKVAVVTICGAHI